MIRVFDVPESIVSDQMFYDALKLAVAVSVEAPTFGGIPVRISNFMPKGTGVLIDGNGIPLKIFKLESNRA